MVWVLLFAACVTDDPQPEAPGADSGATAITRVWAEALGCDSAVAAAPVDMGLPDIDCRTYCVGGEAWPPVLDCRAEMVHTHDLRWSWPLVLDFFDRHPQNGVSSGCIRFAVVASAMRGLVTSTPLSL